MRKEEQDHRKIAVVLFFLFSKRIVVISPQLFDNTFTLLYIIP